MKGKNGIRLWAVLTWLILWQVASILMRRAFTHGALLLPSPLEVIVRLGELAVTEKFWAATGVSAARIFGGFLISCVLAVVLAVAASGVRAVRELLAPAVSVIKAVPVVSFIILALVWIDSDKLSLFISSLMVFPPIYLNVLEGIDSTDKKLLEMAKVFHVPFLRQVRGIYLPHVLPYFRAACSLALGLCWKSGAAAEVIGLPSGTVGERLYTAKVYFQTPDLFAWTVVIVVVSVAFEKLFLALVDQSVKRVNG